MTTEPTRIMARHWRTSPYLPGLDTAVPEAPGVYAIAEVTRHQGLLTEVEHLYVGRSTNLRRRWVEHLDMREPNPALHQLSRSKDLEFWWQRAPRQQIAQLEGALIREVRPRLNRRGIPKFKPTEGGGT
jgi:excinuclease UvrABC nuclease subunit